MEGRLPAGVFTAGNVASTFANTVEATAGGVSSSATVTVAPGALASIKVSPDAVTMAISLSQTFTASGEDAFGNVVPVSPAWSVVSGGGSISTAGSFVAATVPGTYANTVRAGVDAIAGFATVSVTPGPLAVLTVAPDPASVPAGTTQAFTAVGRDAGGNVLSVAPSWSCGEWGR